MSYKLQLDIFEGPLDLLLYLIKKNDLDIYDIPIVKVTEQYMQHIEMMKLLDLEVVGDFLVMAATLIQIKSRMLLPPDPSEQEDAQLDPREELVKRLLEYKVYKEVAEELKVRAAQWQNYFPRNPDEEKMQEIKADATEIHFEANLFDLINAFTKALKRFADNPIHEVMHEEFTVEDKIHEILHQMLKRPRMMISEFFATARSKTEMVVLFMAMLELIRLKEIKVVQKRQFADIEVMQNKEKMSAVTEE